VTPQAYCSQVLNWGKHSECGGRLLLRMCLTSAGVPNGLDEAAIRSAFGAWQLASIERVDLLSDTRAMPAVMTMLVRPAPDDVGTFRQCKPPTSRQMRKFTPRAPMNKHTDSRSRVGP
jgi:hypothetical protein